MKNCVTPRWKKRRYNSKNWHSISGIDKTIIWSIRFRLQGQNQRFSTKYSNKSRKLQVETLEQEINTVVWEKHVVAENQNRSIKKHRTSWLSEIFCKSGIDCRFLTEFSSKIFLIDVLENLIKKGIEDKYESEFRNLPPLGELGNLGLSEYWRKAQNQKLLKLSCPSK